ncbi:MAG: hypothetical protein CLLPBCKN_007637 [Chroococcidiopsis cubana SAG 39.79]|uniref:hypothetical protein n=1 Tax=Chroococcidiopsis cubana TaxID=171392 RepID=UPI00131557FB|nr:hypothetical protein [Chroococcidiopsis cubana]MDZ4878202.1 hypothetical protein [Chroococcidiopsis cubana SAG 39.79]
MSAVQSLKNLAALNVSSFSDWLPVVASHERDRRSLALRFEATAAKIYIKK